MLRSEVGAATKNDTGRSSGGIWSEEMVRMRRVDWFVVMFLGGIGWFGGAVMKIRCDSTVEFDWLIGCCVGSCESPNDLKMWRIWSEMCWGMAIKYWIRGRLKSKRIWMWIDRDDDEAIFAAALVCDWSGLDRTAGLRRNTVVWRTIVVANVVDVINRHGSITTLQDRDSQPNHSVAQRVPALHCNPYAGVQVHYSPSSCLGHLLRAITQQSKSPGPVCTDRHCTWWLWLDRRIYLPLSVAPDHRFMWWFPEEKTNETSFCILWLDQTVIGC